MILAEHLAVLLDACGRTMPVWINIAPGQQVDPSPRSAPDTVCQIDDAAAVGVRGSAFDSYTPKWVYEGLTSASEVK